MKKTLALLLSLMLACGAFASCGNKDNKETDGTPAENVTGTESTEGNGTESESVDTSAFTTEGIITSIYLQKAPGFMAGFMPVDFSDKDSYMTYLGIEDISKIKEAAVSESMLGAQAYSLVVARVADGENAKEIAEEMKNGINPRKWICVAADDIKYTTAGDLICFCMISTEFAEAFTADDAVNAFTKIVNGEAEYVEAPSEEIPEDFAEEIPEADVTDGVIPEDGNTETEPEDNKATSPEDVGEEKSEDTSAAEEAGSESETPAVESESEDTPAKEEKSPEESAENDVPAVEQPAEGKMSPEEIINAMYAIKAPQFMLGFIPVDLSDEFSYNTYLGIKDPSKISEAYVSEPMIGAQAYSLVVARVADGVDANAVAAEMKAGIDPRKWICVEADDIKTAVAGDLVCFCMISTEFAEDFTADDAINAFKAVVK